MEAPPLPPREPDIGMVSCDEFHHGSCRWYDEWSYDVMKDYRSTMNKTWTRFFKALLHDNHIEPRLLAS